MAATKTQRPTSKGKTMKWSTLKREAEKKADAREPRKVTPPFIIDDVEPPIVIEAPDDKRVIDIFALMGPQRNFHPGVMKPLLEALCGPQFPRVWMLIPDNSPVATDMITQLAQMLVDHFISGTIEEEAADLPGGSGASST